jgi:hypothetical protein
MPSREAAQVITIHDLNFLSHPERTRAEIRRDYPRLAHRHAQRADAIIVPSAFTAGESSGRLASLPIGSPSVLMAHPAGHRARRRRTPATSCFSVRSNRARTSAASWMRTSIW